MLAMFQDKPVIGPQGENGKDATINGVNSLTIQAGENLTAIQDGDVLTISAPAIKELSGLVYQCAYPTNKLIFDDVGKPGSYVYIPKFRLCDVISTDDTSIHPAFLVNDSEIPGFYIGKFESCNYNDRAYSLPCEDPSVDVTLDKVTSYNRAKGSKFHEVTVAEWSAVALWCHKNGTEPYGNNKYGIDSRETLHKAVPTYMDGERIGRVATGTGPVTWSHDRTLEGIWDLNGNIWEWCLGMRLVHGELQVIPYNNAADPTCDLSSVSAAWKALRADAASWYDLFVTPDGNGTTQGTVKMDYVNNNWVYTTAITYETANGSCVFSNVTADTSIGDLAKLMLMALTMLPDAGLTGDGIDVGYNGDSLHVNNSGSEQCLLRGGSWGFWSGTGVFSSDLVYTRDFSAPSAGGRSAFIE